MDISELESKFLKADALAQGGDEQAKSDAALFAAEIKRQRSAPAATPEPAAPKQQPLVTLGPEGMKQSLKETLAADVFPAGAKFVGGIGSVMDSAAYRLKQLVGGTLTPQEQAQVQAGRQLSEVGGAPALAGNIAGGMMMTGAPASGLYSGASNLVRTALPNAARIVAPAVGSAVTGGTLGATTQAVLPGESTAGNIAAGTIGGLAGEGVGRAASRVVQPIMQSEPVKKLLAQGIVPTAGQAAGGFLKSAEERLSSIPFLGDVIRWGANRPAKEVQLAVLKTVDPAATQIGREGVQAAQKVASDAYDAALSKFTVSPDTKFSTEARRITNDPAHLLTTEQRGMLDSFIQSKVFDPLRRGGPQAASGQLAKEIDSELGSTAKGYLGSPSQSEKNLGRAFSKLQGEWRDLIERNAPPGVAAEVADANRKWANLTILERAAAKSGADNGEFTVSQLQQAVRESDPSIRKRAFAAGNARGQELSDAAKTVLGNKYPDSGTAGRYLASSALLGTAGALGGEVSGYGPERGGVAGMSVPLALAALAAPAYTRAGSRYMVGNLIPGQQQLSGILSSLSPQAAQAGALANLQRNQP